jgi:hypothetical protein
MVRRGRGDSEGVEVVRKLARVLAIVVSIAAVGFIAACGGSGHSSCADKVAQEYNTNKTVQGTWNCLSPDLQQTAITLGVKKGDDSLFSNGTGTSPVVSYSFVSETNGMDIYAVIVKNPYTGKTFSAVLVIYVDSKGLVTNFGIATPTV